MAASLFLMSHIFRRERDDKKKNDVRGRGAGVSILRASRKNLDNAKKKKKCSPFRCLFENQQFETLHGYGA